MVDGRFVPAVTFFFAVSLFHYLVDMLVSYLTSYPSIYSYWDTDCNIMKCFLLTRSPLCCRHMFAHLH